MPSQVRGNKRQVLWVPSRSKLFVEASSGLGFLVKPDQVRFYYFLKIKKKISMFTYLTLKSFFKSICSSKVFLFRHYRNEICVWPSVFAHNLNKYVLNSSKNVHILELFGVTKYFEICFFCTVNEIL